jgi:uncharacterized protein (TIGR03437 family)
MRCKGFIIPIVISALSAGVAASAATGFGTVVPIGGTASDIVLDEARGVLYIANLGGNTIQVMSMADNAIHTSMNVAANPISMSISPDGRYLLVAHYGNWTATDPNKNLITLINLTDNTRATYSTSDPPLGVAFVSNGEALIVTTTSFLLFDPVSGQISLIKTLANLSTTLPVSQATFPGQISETALTASADGSTVWGIGSAGTGSQMIYQYFASSNTVWAETYVSTPALLPRVSVAADGSYAMIGWSMLSAAGYVPARYPNIVASTNITGHVIDSKNGIVYGQFPDASQPTGAVTASSTVRPAILIMDSDNLTVRDRITIPENMVGRAILNSAASTIYAISDSGVMVLPVGKLNQYHRLAAAQEDVLIQTNFCNTSSVVQTLTITDPGGGTTDFQLTASQGGVTISPASGVTPATVQIRVDPTVLASTGGTASITLTLSSSTAVNQPRPVRLLVNNPDVNQRGTIVDVPGTLTDVLPDPARNRFYIIRQDKNQLQVYDGTSTQLTATLRTATTPTMMAFTIDQKYLLVGSNDSQLVTMYDLDALKAVQPIVLPGGHYGRSIAASNAKLLVLARNELGSVPATIDTVTLGSYSASALASLGDYTNSVSATAVLSPSPNGATIMMASPDGNVMLYSAASDNFTVSRKDLTALSGAFASSAYNTYVIGNTVFNASLVPQSTLSTATGATASGFYFLNQGGYLVTAATASGPGTIQNLSSLQTTTVKATAMVEAPLLPSAGSTSSSSSSSSSTGSGSTSTYTLNSFTRTVAPLTSSGTIIVLTTSGFTVLSANYDAATAPPSISSVVNAANGSAAVAPGGLISVYGQNMSAVNMATSQIPLPTALGESCLVVNGALVPLLFVSSQQINGQLPYNVVGSSTLAIHTPAGISNNYLFTVLPAAPSVFQTGTAGPETGLATIIRADNSQLVTPTNPIHPKDTVVIYLTGMGQTFPQSTAGLASPSSPLASAVLQPNVTLGGAALSVSFAGLTPNSVGLYQIDAYVPDGVPQGLSIPLVIDQGGSQTTLNVRVVN